MSAAFSIGLSGLSVSQRVLDLTGHNVANAQTRGYHRQVADLANRSVGNPIGDGVRIKDIQRFQSGPLEAAATQNAIEAEAVTAKLDTLRQLETELNPTSNSSLQLLMKFFSEVQQAGAQPDNLGRRGAIVATAISLINRIGGQSANLGQLGRNLDALVEQLVRDLNSTTPQIARLNQQIQQAEITGQGGNDLKDQRDQLINDLASIINIRTVDQEFGQKTVLAGGQAVVVGGQSLALASSVDTANNRIVTGAASQTALTITGGKLGGLLEVRNLVLTDLRNRLDTMTRGLVSSVDGLHATGLGLSGGFVRVAGQRAVSNVNTPLASAGLAFPPQAGSLFISVTNLASGQRTTSEVVINPATDSLSTLAANLSAVPNIQGIADTQTRTLQVLAAPGFAVDFAGRLPTAPDSTAISGTTVPQPSGRFTGTANDVYRFTVVGSGTVGVTPGLALEARDSALNLLGTLNIGQGYEPGTPAPAVNGVAVRLSAGTANAGDNFTVRVVAQPDTANILTALGLNSFFTGDNSSNVGVRADLQAQPELLAGSRTGQPGDGANFVRLAALQDAQLLAGGTQTLREFESVTVVNLGVQVRDLNQRQSAQQVLRQRLDAEIQSLSGVDPNEELVRLLHFQRSFQMSARYIATVNTALDDLLAIV